MYICYKNSMYISHIAVFGYGTLGYNAAEATYNISCVKGEDVVDHNTVT